MTDPVGARLADMIQARGAEYARAIEARREHERERKREARRRQTPDQIDRERARKRETRTLLTLEQKEREREQRRSRKKLRPFMGVDGEGGGTDEFRWPPRSATGDDPPECWRADASWIARFMRSLAWRCGRPGRAPLWPKQG
jgi:hypothetical protein